MKCPFYKEASCDFKVAEITRDSEDGLQSQIRIGEVGHSDHSEAEGLDNKTSLYVKTRFQEFTHISRLMPIAAVTWIIGEKIWQSGH
jgi:hypothetical protein